jgi:hypothetical protein
LPLKRRSTWIDVSDLIIIVVAAAAAALLADRTDFARGRLSGLKEASDQLIRDVAYQYQYQHDKQASEAVLKALNEIKARLAKQQPARMTCEAVSAGLCELGAPSATLLLRKALKSWPGSSSVV